MTERADEERDGGALGVRWVDGVGGGGGGRGYLEENWSSLFLKRRLKVVRAP